MIDELLRRDRDDEHRFEIRVRDFHTMREWQITQPPIDHGDFGYMRAILERISPEMREFIINTATLLLKAVEPLE